MSTEQTPDIADVLADLIADDPMWIGDDGQPLDYLPEREARIADFVAAADAALAPVLDAAVREARAAELREAVVGLRAASRPFETGLGIDFASAWLRDRADRITEPVSHEAATSGEEASKA